MSTKRITSVDVARIAGVSRATVSAVLNRTRPVSDELVQKVSAAMAELHYQPDAVARSLKASRTYRIGLLVGNIASPFWATVINAVESVAYEHHFHLILGDNNDDPALELSHLEMMSQERVDGIILAPCGERNRAMIVSLAADIPLVLFDRHLSNIPIDYVAGDNEYGGYIATRHLIEAAHLDRIACLTLNLELSNGADRLAGYQRALVEFGIPRNPSWIKLGDYTEDSGYRDTIDLLRQADRPHAIFASSHLKAVGALRAARDCGLRVPDDVALVGFDEMPWASFMSPQLTVVAQPVAQMAAQAAQLLVRRIHGRWQDGGEASSVVEQVLHRPKLIDRESCGCRRWKA
jgi:LacI family transcriptional regulator